MLYIRSRRYRLIRQVSCLSIALLMALYVAVPPVAAAPIDISRWEMLVYGKTYSDAFHSRLVRLETDLYGQEQQGLVPNRVFDIQMKVEDVPVPESIPMKLRAIEWKCSQAVNETNVTDRLNALESFFYGKPQSGPIIKRTDDLVSAWFVGGTLPTAEVTVPKGTELLLTLKTPISSADATIGQEYDVTVANDLVINGTLVLPKGSSGKVVVIDAAPAGNAFQRARLQVKVEFVKAIDGRRIPIENYQAGPLEAQAQDATAQVAMGVSMAGLVILGPVGAAAGLLVKGNQITLPEGWSIKAVVQEDTLVLGIKDPGIRG